MKTWLVILALVLTGCANNPGIVSPEKDTYQIVKRNPQFGFERAEELKKDAYREANDFCAKLNKKMETVSFEISDVGMLTPGSVSLQFRCVRNVTTK
ncbi:MAG: hypothetical protein CSYNP_02552 [Syntrophus sp. SKADARSKE-3]|nr:hypothetical protein [Syntrophus sp. SKADARSKE-3]